MRFLITLIFFFFITPSHAQDHPVINAWMEFGTFRITPVKYDRSAGVDLAVKVQVNRIISTLQYQDCYDSEESEFFEIFSSDNHYHAGNLLLGITNKKCSFGHVSVSSGLGFFWGTFENPGIEKFATIGFPLEAAASINLFRFVGLNLKVFTNLNSEHSFVGFGMDVQLGKLRDYDLRELIPGL